VGLSGGIARSKARLDRDDADRLLFRWRGSVFDLERCVVRHRDDDGEVTFSVRAPDGSGFGARYRRRGPRLRDAIWDAIDFVADEPWTWEDGDFGLRVFNVATGTGPEKYRHWIRPRDEDATAAHTEARRLIVEDEGVTRERWGGRTERVLFAELDEIRVKFELSGVWAESSVFVLHTADDLAVVPLASSNTEFAQVEPLPRLRRLQGWGSVAERAFSDACEYASRQRVGPARDEGPESRAERPMWSRP